MIRLIGRIVGCALAGVVLCASAASAEQSTAQTICGLIETAAGAHGLPNAFFTRLIWRESSFRPHVTSPAGAQGIAQFMPGTARERSVSDPFDPEVAIPASAAFLAELKQRFGNLGLAAAAYNAGPNRVARWLSEEGGLPLETRAYVRFVTGRSAEEWRPEADQVPAEPPATSDCLTVVASLRVTEPAILIEGAYAPFGVQLAGNPSKARAVAAYQRVVARFPTLLAERPTLVLGSPVPGRGRGRFYRVRLPAQTLREASLFCNRLRQAGGSCAVLRN